MPPRETEVSLMTLKIFSTLESALQVKRKHKGFCHEAGQGNFF